MEERATGLILRTRPLTETSLIVHWLTREAGRISTVAKGARRPKSPFAGKLDLFHLAEFTFHRSRRSDLHTLHEVAVLDFHPGLRREVLALQQGACFVQLLELATEPETPLGELFDLLIDAIGFLGEGPVRPAGVFAFELKLLTESGLAPDLGKASLRAETATILEALLEDEWRDSATMELPPATSSEIDRFLRGFITFHLGRLPKGRSAALEGEFAATLRRR